MATGSWPTIVDVSSRLAPNGEQMPIAEQLSQSVALYEDMPMLEASEIGGHAFAYRTSIPTGSWRQAYQGTPYGKSTSGQGKIGLGELTAYSQIDRSVAEMSGDPAGVRESEDVAFIEGMGQTMEQTAWYGNSTINPASFMGFSPFFDAIAAGGQEAANIINGGGTGSSNASMWLIGWGPRTVYGVYPRASKAGLTIEDKGTSQTGYDSLGNPFEAYTTWFRQQCGLVPQDWRNIVRICNLDVTTAGLAGPAAPDLWAMMSQAVKLPPALGKTISGIGKVDAPTDPSPGVRPVFYVNRSVSTFMDIQGMRGRNVLLTVNDAAGKPQDMFRGVPVKISDRLVDTEAAVV
jgi:hypothetical protein